MKRFIVCFNDTSTEIDKDEPTNVLLLASAMAKAHKSVPEIIYYAEGVGNEPGRKSPEDRTATAFAERKAVSTSIGSRGRKAKLKEKARIIAVDELTFDVENFMFELRDITAKKLAEY